MSELTSKLNYIPDDILFHVKSFLSYNDQQEVELSLFTYNQLRAFRETEATYDDLDAHEYEYNYEYDHYYESNNTGFALSEFDCYEMLCSNSACHFSDYY